MKKRGGRAAGHTLQQEGARPAISQAEGLRAAKVRQDGAPRPTRRQQAPPPAPRAARPRPGSPAERPPAAWGSRRPPDGAESPLERPEQHTASTAASAAAIATGKRAFATTPTMPAAYNSQSAPGSPVNPAVAGSRRPAPLPLAAPNGGTDSPPAPSETNFANVAERRRLCDLAAALRHTNRRGCPGKCCLFTPEPSSRCPTCSRESGGSQPAGRDPSGGPTTPFTGVA